MEDARLHGLAADEILHARDVTDKLLSDTETIDLLVEWSQILAASIAHGGSLFFAGNGGSFADALHLAAEFTGKMGRSRPPLAAYALGSNGSSVTAIGNDYAFEHVFSREFLGLYRPPSALLVMSTSGRSPSILRAVEAALSVDAPVLAFSGSSGGVLTEMCDTILAPSARTERIQEAHILLGHVLCGLVESRLAGISFEWD